MSTGCSDDYAELHVLSNFSFLRGASHPEELVTEAVRLGYRAIALTDEFGASALSAERAAAWKRNGELLRDICRPAP